MKRYFTNILKKGILPVCCAIGWAGAFAQKSAPGDFYNDRKKADPTYILDTAFEVKGISPFALEDLKVGDVTLLHKTAKETNPRFHVLALYENGGHHLLYSKAATVWLDKLAEDSGFAIDYITNTIPINDSLLARYQLFIQLDYAPYAWTDTAAKAFIKYIEQGKGGWIGFHHASLLGEFDGYPMWQWFYHFMGSVRWKDYIPTFADATVHVEDTANPCMKGVPPLFNVIKEEWYTYYKSPRPDVHVIASVDEKSYKPSSTVAMGDHPVVWSNNRVAARNIYIFMGHSPQLFNNVAYTTLFRNAIFWAAEK